MKFDVKRQFYFDFTSILRRFPAGGPVEVDFPTILFLDRSHAQVMFLCETTAPACSTNEIFESPRAASLRGLQPQPAVSQPQPTPLQPHHDDYHPDFFPLATTTLMLKNICNRLTAEELIHDFVGCGFARTFDFFYLPTDFATKRNKGYAFVNFCSQEFAERFREAYESVKFDRYSTQKVLTCTPAVTQGLEANVLKYLKHKSRVQNPWFRPMIFTCRTRAESRR